MSGPYRACIVQADGVVYELGNGRLKREGTAYPHPSSARRALRKYIGDGKHLGAYRAFVTDDNDGERRVEI